MAKFTLDDIRAAAEAKYGATEIEVDGKTVRLLNALRLPKAKRDELLAMQNDEEGNEKEEVADEELHKIIELVAETEEQAIRLIDAVGDDLGVLAEIVETYTKGTQAGEASPSHD